MTILPQLIKKTQGQFFQTALASKNNICLVDLFELAVVQLCIESVLCQQFFVVALLNDIAVFHDKDQVRPAVDLCIASWINCSVLVSTDDVASSRIRNGASSTIARAIVINCF